MRSKLLVFLILLGCMQSFAAPSGQSGITLSRKGATVSEILDAVEAQSGFIFVTSGTDLTMKKDIDVRNAGIEEVLRVLFAGTDINWTVSGVNVYLSNKGTQVKPTATNGPLGVTGNVTVSFIGLLDRKLTFSGSEKDIVITLLEDQNVLDDVVVVGYGTQRRVNVTGAVAVVDGKDLNNRPVTNTAIALQGADPGLLLTMGNGSIEGRNYTMNIRGAVSLNSGSPLVLVDGIEGNLENVNPNDIESVSILKDASACAVYGAKASAGVVLITTRSGSEGVTRITYNGRGGVSTNTTATDFITTSYDYTTLTNEFYNYYRGINAWTFTDEQMQMMKDRRNDKTENPERPWIIPDESGLYTYVYLGNFEW